MLGIGIIAALAVMVTPALIAQERWGFLAVFWGVVALLLAVYATKRAVPAKYLLPGVLFLSLLVVYPILMTFQLSTTNYGDGTRTSKEVTINKIIASSRLPGGRTRGASRWPSAPRAPPTPGPTRSSWSTRPPGTPTPAPRTG